MSEAVKLISICNRSGVALIDKPQIIYFLTEVLPSKEVSNVRLPLNFTLVLDRSGSMAGEKLSTMKEAVKSIIDQLEPDDVISIVTFETKTQVLVPAQFATDKDLLREKVDKIKDGGGTNMGNGLLEGYKQATQHHSNDRVSRLVLLTDGEATDEAANSRNVADHAGEKGIPIIGLGIGQDWNEEYLFDLADRSILASPGSHTGKADYIPSPQEVNRIFQEVYQSMQVVAQDVTLTIRMVQGLEARRVWQYLPLIRDLGSDLIQGRAIVIPIDQLEKSGTGYLIELMLPPRPEGRVRIAQTELTYRLPGGIEQKEAVDLIVYFSDNPSVLNQIDGHVMNIVEKIQAFKLQTQALDEIQIGNVEGATRRLRQAVTILLSQGDSELADQLDEEANHLEKSGQISSDGKKTIMLTSRKTVRLSE